MRKVFLDTNFRIDLIKFKLRLEAIQEILQDQARLLVLSATIRELEGMAKEEGKASKLAKLALKMIKLKKIDVLEIEGESPDKAFLSLADKNTIIATNDSELRKKLKKLGIKTIYLRGRKKLEVS